MAITKIHAIKSTLGKALAYIENPDKTDGQMLVSGYNCEPQTASIDFEMTAVLAHKARNLKRKRSTNLAYHLIQSFSPEDAVTPEQAHELGKKLAFEYTGGKYEYVVATHIDKGHIHNHIMINAVSFYDYKKLRTVPYRTARQIRDISDRLCMEAHLSVIDDPQKIGQLYPENAGKKKSVSNRTEIRKRLNFAWSGQRIIVSFFLWQRNWKSHLQFAVSILAICWRVRVNLSGIIAYLILIHLPMPVFAPDCLTMHKSKNT